jgi:GAF domain-containing protein
MRLYVHHNTTIYYCGIQPQRLGDGSDRLVEQHLLWQDFLHSGHVPHAGDSALSSERTWVITDLSYEFCLRTLATAFELPEIEQVMVVPLRHAGQLMGCLSAFRDRTQPPWDLAQVVLAQQFAQEFAQAIHEHQLTQQVRQLSQAFAVQPGELQQIIRNMLTIWTDHSELQSSEVLGEVLRLKASV